MAYSIFMKINHNEGLNKQTEKQKASSIVQLEVLNGCGTSGIADKFTDYLRKQNFDVVQIGNYISFDIDKIH